MRDRGGLVAYGDQRLLRACCGLLLGGLIATGCTGGGDDGKRPDGKGGTRTSAAPTSAAPTSAAPTTAAPAPTALDFVPDPKRAPKTEADARRIALAVVGGPDAWGPEYVKRTPHLSDPDYWPVLGANCSWETGTRPSTVLSSVTAYSEVPADGARGTLRVAATVTVHRTEADADWEMAGTLEEALRCPDQKLRDGERISGLISLGNPFGVGGNFTADDSLGERGIYLNDAVKGDQFYGWYQSRIGQVTVATVVKGAPGYSEQDTATTVGTIPAQVQALVTMLERAQDELEVQS
ncbi:hypothetical protein OG357_15925 [Streptomyces sp. NBC_01255]|uniref:hypothetical protein n=1 Tax=Streptomyces sp. NBC_01255 TaxID=2903798 RepID=UPI002E33E845|nr:hypothetical protein [Streptomyces sp. NBC_01255]